MAALCRVDVYDTAINRRTNILRRYRLLTQLQGRKLGYRATVTGQKVELVPIIIATQS